MAEIVDGNDVLAVHSATERALAHVRAGNGPYLLECKTFRMTGHSAHDAAHYVPPHLENGNLMPGHLEPRIRNGELRAIDPRFAAEQFIDASLHLLRAVDMERKLRNVPHAHPFQQFMPDIASC